MGSCFPFIFNTQVLFCACSYKVSIYNCKLEKTSLFLFNFVLLYKYNMFKLKKDRTFNIHVLTYPTCSGSSPPAVNSTANDDALAFPLLLVS